MASQSALTGRSHAGRASPYDEYVEAARMLVRASEDVWVCNAGQHFPALAPVGARAAVRTECAWPDGLARVHVLHPACVRNERTTDLDETRDVVLQDVVKPVGPGMRWPKMTGTLISRENFSMNGTQTPAGVRSLLTGTLLGVKADVETEEIDAFVMKGLGKGKEVVPFAAARVQVKKRKAV